jgi:hypothetical protein
MTYISIVCRKFGSIVISKISADDDYTSVDYYTFNNKTKNATRFIRELRAMIDPYETEIVVINFDEFSGMDYMNQIYGSLHTLKLFGTVNKVTYISDPTKMFRRVFRYVGAGKGRKMTRDGVADMLLGSCSCKFYTKLVEINIANKSKQLYNLHRMGLVSVYYMLIKNKLQGKNG